MSTTQTSSKQSPRERLLQLVALYHAATKHNTTLPPEDQQELEALVMSELRMPLDKAKNLLVHLVQYNEDDASEDDENLEEDAIADDDEGE